MQRPSASTQLQFLATSLLVILAPFLYLTRFHNYPLLSLEVAILFSALIGLGTVFWIVTRSLSSNMAALGLVLLGLGSIQMLFNKDRLVAWAIGLLMLLILVFFRQHLVYILFVVVLVFDTSVVFLPVGATPLLSRREGDSPLKVNRSLPPVIHILLDEHLGPGGFPDDPAWLTWKEELQSTYVERGFRLFPNAISEYQSTRDSVRHALVDSGYFKDLESKGYIFRMYQPRDYPPCEAVDSIEHCTEYTWNSIEPLRQSNLSSLQRAVYLGVYFANQAGLYRFIRKTYWKLQRKEWFPLPDWEWRGEKAFPFTMMDILPLMEQDLRDLQNGEVLFAHLFLPHYPYVFGGGCEPQPWAWQWLDHTSPSAPDPSHNSEESRERRYERYLEQMKCTQELVLGSLSRNLAPQLLESATIVVHSDHGSRISIHEPNEKNWGLLTNRDLLDHYSTFFAVKGPGVPAGVDPCLVTLEDAVGTLIGVEPNCVSGELPVYLRFSDQQVLLGIN
jgi:hypothetical protein